MSVGTLHEQNFNVALGRALRRANPRWTSEPHRLQVEPLGVVTDSSRRKIRPDILVCDEQLPPVVLECSYAPADAEKDAMARLGCTYNILPIQTAMAVFVPGQFRQLQTDRCVDELMEGRPVFSSIFQLLKSRQQLAAPDLFDRRWPNTGFLEGSVHDLSSLVTGTALPKEKIESVAAEIAALVDKAADFMTQLTVDDLQSIASSVHQRSPLKALRTVMVLWLNALLIQQRLHQQSVEAATPVGLPVDALPKPSEQISIWKKIHCQNWRSIFGPATEALELAGRLHPHASSRALLALIRAVEEIEIAQLGLHINIGAELFPKLSDDRKQAAAFYTQPSTAEILATLTILPGALPPAEWAQGELFRNHRLADLACGTGTLLRAGYRRIASLHERHGGTLDSLRTLHATAMEKGLVGTDISPIAAHLTASSLAAIGQGEPYGDNNIGWVNVGGHGKGARAGSLEYFAAPQVVDLFGDTGGVSMGDASADKQTVAVEDGSCDWILMNPPYSRTRGGQSAFDVAGLTESERKACQKRWGTLVKGQEVNRKAGLAASFLALANKKIKPGGRIGFVLPLTAAFAETWAITRKMIEESFDDITAITVAAGQALGRDALSADTNMEEMLLVAMKRSVPSQERSHKAATIQCVTLTSTVSRIGEAEQIARAITGACARAGGNALPIRVGDDGVGQLYCYSKASNGSPWHPLGVVHGELARFAAGLESGLLEFSDLRDKLKVPMATLDELFGVGPTHDLIGHLAGKDPRGAFEFHATAGGPDNIGADRSLWAADSKTQTSMATSPTHKGFAPAGVGSETRRAAMRKFQSMLFYARNMRWTSQKILVAATRQSAHGGRAWTTLQHGQPDLRKAFALWANSTLGMILHWTQGQRTHAGRSTTQIAALKSIPCPDLTQLGDAYLARAAADFDALCSQPLLPACQAHADPVRQQIDDAVIRMLSLSDDMAATVPKLRWLWCNEPSVHARNKAALRKIEEADQLF